jgi:hypothetical protein
VNILIVFSGIKGSVGGTQSWINNLQEKYGFNLSVVYLGCTKNNFHFPAFQVRNKIATNVVLACDPLSLYWVRNNVNYFSLIIGFYHKNEWNLERTSFLEEKVIDTVEKANLCFTFSNIKLPHFLHNVPRISIPLLPRKDFKQPVLFDQENKNIIILARLEKFKGYPAHLPNISKWLSNLQSDIIIHVVGKGSLFAELSSLQLPNVKFWGTLSPLEIKEIVKCCRVGISSGIGAIELTSVGLPVIVPMEDSLNLDVTCVTSSGFFILQDESTDTSINFYDVLNTHLFIDRSNWELLSTKASNAVIKDFNYDKLFEFENKNKVSFKISFINNLIIYADYLFRIILDKLKLKKFGFINRID